MATLKSQPVLKEFESILEGREICLGFLQSHATNFPVILELWNAELCFLCWIIRQGCWILAMPADYGVNFKVLSYVDTPIRITRLRIWVLLCHGELVFVLVDSCFRNTFMKDPKKKTRLRVKWTHMFWRSVQNYLFPSLFYNTDNSIFLSFTSFTSEFWSRIRAYGLMK